MVISLSFSFYPTNYAARISSELVVARGDAAVMLDFVEEALDEIALAISRITVARHLAVGLWRDHWMMARLSGCGSTIGVVALSPIRARLPFR